MDSAAVKARIMDKCKGALLKQDLILQSKRKMVNQQGYLSENKEEAESGLEQAHIAKQERSKVPRTETDGGVGAYGHDKRLTSLKDVSDRRLQAWKEHSTPDHSCSFGPKCWFKSTHPMPIIKLYLESLKSNPNRNPFIR